MNLKLRGIASFDALRDRPGWSGSAAHPKGGQPRDRKSLGLDVVTDGRTLAEVLFYHVKSSDFRD